MNSTSTPVPDQSTFDYIVCGAGSSGSVVAARLAEGGSRSVLVLEAGGSDDVATVRDPNMWPMNLGGALDWAFMTQPNAELDGRAIPFNMGKVLGGGSSINVGTWSRGHKADWNFYAQASGESAWSYPEVLRVYTDKIEAWSGSSDPLRGRDGSMRVNQAADLHPFAEAVLQSAELLGIKRFPSSNGAMMEAEGGCSIIDEIVVDGERQSVYRRYLAPLLGKPNLTVLKKATVYRVLFDGDRAIGVECVVDGCPQVFHAGEHVVLSMGAINTPRVLLQSGIGPASKLEPAGIPVRVDLPAVGEHLHDHVGFSCVWGASDAALPPAPRSQISCFWKTDEAQDSPNAYTYVTSGAWLTEENAANHPVPEAAWSLVVGARLKGRGSVTVSGADSDADVVIQSGYLSDSDDMATVMAAAKRAIAIGNQIPMAAWSTGIAAPSASGDEQLETYLRRGLTTFWHQSGSARMGRNASDSVVDGRLKVHGVERLMVADASIFPRVTSGNTMAPSVVVGELAAMFLA